MKKSVLALVMALALASVSGAAVAQRGGGGGMHGGGGGWSGGGGGWHGGGGSWNGGGWHGGSGWHGGAWNGGWHGGWGWRGCWGCGGWWWGGAAIVATSPWWGWPWWWNAPYWGAWGGPTWSATSSAWDPVVYVDPSQQQQSAPTGPAVPSGAPVTWFYCSNPAGYYPYVQSCTRPWMRVVPDATQPPPQMQQPGPQG